MDRCADRNLLEQQGDVLGIKSHAAVTRTHPHSVGLVRAVNQVAWPTERHRIGAKRIIRTGRNLLRQWIAIFAMFLADGIWRSPNRILAFTGHLGGTLRRRPADFA